MSGPAPIKISEIEAYCRLNGIPGEARIDLARLVPILDGEYLRWYADNKQQPQARK